MQGEPGVDYPEDRSPVDVLAASRGDAVMCFVERIAEDEIVVTIGQDRSGRPVNLHAEERMELVWKDAGELRSLPAELVAVETGEQRVWRIRPVGPAARGQHRAAVRAPLPYRAVLEFGGVTTEGTTVDVSEGGVRGLFDLATPATGPDAAAAAVEPGGTDGGSGVPVRGWARSSPSASGSTSAST